MNSGSLPTWHCTGVVSYPTPPCPSIVSDFTNFDSTPSRVGLCMRGTPLSHWWGWPPAPLSPMQQAQWLPLQGHNRL